jgi:RepB DNA-primase from phage plasmid
VVAARIAMDQLEALGAECFDIGVKRVDGTMVLREGWGAKQVLKSLLWLRRENLNRGHIYVRPAGAHGLSLVDDLKADTVVRMKVDGFAPAAVVETSPGNFQAWLKHGEVLDEVASTRAAKVLAERYGGDPGSADWRHFGRLAGFTNPKPSRRLASGLQPFARLLEASGQVYRQAPVFIAKVRAALAGEGAVIGAGDEGRAGEGDPELPPIKPLAGFHSDARYDGDLHRADLAWARHAADMGLSAREIRATIMEARDLAKKGSIKRQREYAERTAGKAMRQTE